MAELSPTGSTQIKFQPWNWVTEVAYPSKIKTRVDLGDFSDGPVVKTLCFQSTGLIPGQGTKILRTAWHGLKQNKKNWSSKMTLSIT